MSENLVGRWVRRYKLFFLLGLLILGLQVFLAYKSFDLSTTVPHSSTVAAEFGGRARNTNNAVAGGTSNQNSANDDEDAHVNLEAKQKAAKVATPVVNAVAAIAGTDHGLKTEQLGFDPPCNIKAKEAISALQRAKTKDCRKQIAHIACAIQTDHFYALRLPHNCPAGNHTANRPLGCYRDEKDFRLLPGYFANYKTTNSPLHCIQICLQYAYTYAGVQHGGECYCGAEPPPMSAQLADSSCNMKCAGDAKQICGGYYSMNIYETGIAKFTAQAAQSHAQPGTESVRIAFLLTLNGRALRQVHRLIKALYSPHHFFYIHVDARQDYLYRKLLELEPHIPNLRVTRKRFSSIWGGVSLLTMLLQCMEDLLNSPWQWDFVINLSESDYPVKTLIKLVGFLTANKGRNFVKSHGRETQRFIQKQGLDKTFVECDTHMWRLGDRQLPFGILMDGGSDWVALSRPFIEYVTSQSQNDELLRGLLVLFQHTLLPAESFFHTVLRNSRFCNTYVDNNLHITNWKRKLGCRCQYRHLVDWCGCSPNDFKPEDWTRLQGTSSKQLYFARKFEPVINQAVLLQLDVWLYGPYPKDYVNLNAYWQSFYDARDQSSLTDNLLRTVGNSLVRLVARKFQLKPDDLLEMTHYLHNDQYKGFLVRHRAWHLQTNSSLELETRIRPFQYAQYATNSKFATRLRNFEVSSEFDQKEQVSRNFAKILGPNSEPVLSFTLTGIDSAEKSDILHSYNLTLLWIDSTGRLQDCNELHIEDSRTDAINYSKPLIKQPLTPGIWTVKMVGRAGVYALTKFLVVPISVEAGESISIERAKVLNGGTGLSLADEFEIPTDWLQYLPPPDDVQVLLQLAKANTKRSFESLLNWIDDLVGKFFALRETCNIAKTTVLEAVPLCRETAWSTLAPDPKSDIKNLTPRG